MGLERGERGTVEFSGMGLERGERGTMSSVEWFWKGEREAQCRVPWNGFGKGRERHNVEASGMGMERGETSTM